MVGQKCEQNFFCARGLRILMHLRTMHMQGPRQRKPSHLLLQAIHIGGIKATATATTTASTRNGVDEIAARGRDHQRSQGFWRNCQTSIGCCFRRQGSRQQDVHARSDQQNNNEALHLFRISSDVFLGMVFISVGRFLDFPCRLFFQHNKTPS